MLSFRSVTPRLPVRDLPRAIAFYTDRLGFRVDVCWPSVRPTFAILVRDSVSVGFFEPSEHQPGPIGYAELYIEISDAAGLASQLRTEIAIEWGPEVYAYGRREFAVRDPHGYLVIFTEPTEDSPTTSDPD